MIHRFKKQISFILALALIFTLLPSVSAAYSNGYAGGMAGDGMGIYAHGVDLSEWQGSQVDFQKLKAQGYSFVILRVGFATTVDDCFENNYIRAKEAGLDVGVYLYSYADNEAEALKEADACKTWLSGRQLEYPVYYDLEDPKTHGNMSKAQLSAIATAFLNEMSADGWLVGLYSCLSWLNYRIDTPNVCALYECWMAQYLHSGSYEIYDRYDEVYGMWQYSATGRVDGVEGNVDMNVSFKDYPGICRRYGFNGYTASDESLILSGVTVPDAMKTGKGFAVKGTVTSNKGILSNVTVGIYDQTGTAVMARSGSKGKNSFDLSLFAADIRPNDLEEGKYYYRISASNSYETMILLNHPFWVSDSGTITENINYPENLHIGDSFAPAGFLYGVGKLSEVRLTVEDMNGKAVVKASAFPNQTSCDLSKLQESFDVSRLTAGEYHYRIYATMDGAQQQVFSVGFAVWLKDDPIVMSGYSLRREYNPGELTAIAGTLTSQNSNIRRIQIHIRNSRGETVSLVDEACNLKKLSLEDFNDDLNLQLLSVGQYSCRITATNAAGPVLMSSNTFLIREDALSLCELSAPTVLREGDSFCLTGAVAGNVSPLEYVGVSIYDAMGECVLSVGDVPNSNVYDLSRLQDKLLFSALSAGEYSLCVTAENARACEVLHEAPFTVIDHPDGISWKSDAFCPGGMSYSQSAPFALSGTLISGVSDIKEVKVEILDGENAPVTLAVLAGDSREVSLESCNEMLRLPALAPGSYELRISATNRSGSFTLLCSEFSISECLHANVASGNSFYATCLSVGAVCDSQCLDCGDKVRNGVLLPVAEHEYRSDLCGGCGRSQFRFVKVSIINEELKDNDRIVIAANLGDAWYALGMDGNAVPIQAPKEGTDFFVTADLLWTVEMNRKRLCLRNAFGKPLHLDSTGIAVCHGNRNCNLLIDSADGAWSVALAGEYSSRFLSFSDGKFVLSAENAALVLLRYVPENREN